MYFCLHYCEIQRWSLLQEGLDPKTKRIVFISESYMVGKMEISDLKPFCFSNPSRKKMAS